MENIETLDVVDTLTDTQLFNADANGELDLAAVEVQQDATDLGAEGLDEITADVTVH